MSDFAKALAYTLVNEGTTFTNDNKDRGGPTKLGITLKSLASYRERHSQPAPTAEDVEKLTEAEASNIYLEDYWDEMLLSAIADQEIATAIFDMSVNFGVKGCTHLIQHVVGLTGDKADGVMGPHTIDAVNRTPAKDFIFKFSQSVFDHYIDVVLNNPNQIKFLKGWAHRTQRLFSLLT